VSIGRGWDAPAAYPAGPPGGSASAAITVQGFAQPEMMIEVQGIAVTA